MEAWWEVGVAGKIVWLLNLISWGFFVGMLLLSLWHGVHIQIGKSEEGALISLELYGAKRHFK